MCCIFVVIFCNFCRIFVVIFCNFVVFLSCLCSLVDETRITCSFLIHSIDDIFN